MDTADVAQEKVDRATRAALINHEVAPSTLVVLIRGPRKRDVIHQITCRPSNRPAELAKLGININNPLRSRRHAYAWVDDNGRLHVGGTSEMGKERLRVMHSALSIAREDIVLI